VQGRDITSTAIVDTTVKLIIPLSIINDDPAWWAIQSLQVPGNFNLNTFEVS
jgi:hypothetical protein